METITIPLSSIVADPEFNVRKVYDGVAKPGDEGKFDAPGLLVESLMAGIERDGLLTPLVVRPPQAGRYHLVAGFRRWNALRALQERMGLTRLSTRSTEDDERLKALGGPITKTNKTNYDNVSVNVYGGSEEECYYLNMNENLDRKSLTPYEVAARCHLMRKKFKNSDDLIMKRTGLSKSHIGNIIRVIDQCDDKILDAWKDELKGLMISDMITWCTLPKVEQVELFETAIANTGKKKKRGASDSTVTNGKKLRPGLESLENARLSIENSDKDSDTKEAMLEVIDFALGNVEQIYGVYDPSEDLARKEVENAKARDEEALVKSAALFPAVKTAIAVTRPDLTKRIEAMEVFLAEKAKEKAARPPKTKTV